MADATIIELKNIQHTFTLDSGRKVQVLKDINLSIEDGEVLVLLGPSGSGKSTCLRIIAGLIQPSDGQVYLNHQPLHGINGSLALVFQNFALLPWLSVAENISIGLKPQKLSDAETKERVKKTIDIVGLEGFEEAYPRELSGGMKQRVGIARALVMNRPILALDEPFSALDVLTAESLRREVLQVWKSKKTNTRALILVTHNIAEAVSMGGRIVVMGSGPGHIRYVIENKLPYPRSEKSADFINLVENIHDILTEAILPDMAPQASKATLQPQIEAIPPVSLIEVTGLLEAVASEGGEVNALKIAQKMMRDAVHILMMTHAAEMIGLVDTPKNVIILTERGNEFVHGDVNHRKKLIHNHMLELPLVKVLREKLGESTNLSISKDTAETMIHSLLPNESPESVLDTLIQWGRFGELLGYSDDTKTVYLDRG